MGGHEIMRTAEWLAEMEYRPSRWSGEFDDSPVVVLEPAGIGECDTCHRSDVRVYEVGPMDEGAWVECEPCVRLAAARSGQRGSIRPGLLVRMLLAVTVLCVLLGPGLRWARADGTTAHYDLRTGMGPAVVILRHCYAEDDFGAGLKVVDYSRDRTVMRCTGPPLSAHGGPHLCRAGAGGRPRGGA